MGNYKNKLVVLALCIFLAFLLSDCSKKTSSEPSPEKQKQQFDWVNESFTIHADSSKYFSSELIIYDTLNIEISVIKGDYIQYFFFTNEYNFHKWEAGEPHGVYLSRTQSEGGTFTSVIPYDFKGYFVFYNSPLIDSIEVQARITVTRWTY